MSLEKIKEVLGQRFSQDTDFLNNIVSDLDLPKDSKILDIGTGWGFMAITLALHGYDVITGEPFDAENLPFANASFDVVFLYTSLHHINNKSQAFSEILRVIKPDGCLVVVELTEEGVDLIRKRHINHPDAINPRDFINADDIEFILRESRYLNAYIFMRNHRYE